MIRHETVQRYDREGEASDPMRLAIGWLAYSLRCGAMMGQEHSLPNGDRDDYCGHEGIALRLEQEQARLTRLKHALAKWIEADKKACSWASPETFRGSLVAESELKNVARAIFGFED